MNMTNNFFGRKDLLELFKKRVAGLKEGYRQNIAVLGGRFMGKSSLVGEFLANLDDDHVVATYACLDVKDFHYVFVKFAGSLLHNFSRIQKLPLNDDLSLLIETTQRYLPKTTQLIRKIQEQIHKKKWGEAYRQLLNLPEIFSAESGKFCLVILDEFHHLDDLAGSHSFGELGKKIMMQKHCLYIMTSSAENKAQEILSEKLSLLFGNFEVVSIGPFDLKVSQDFIAYNLQGLKLGKPLANFLIDFSGGHPLYLNLICQQLTRLSAVHKQQEIFTPLLVQSLEDTLFDPWGVLNRHFELIVNDLCQGRGHCRTSSVLIMLAQGKYKVKEMATDLGIKQTHLTQKLNKLNEMGIVLKNGAFYHFRDKLFKYWIKYVFQHRLKPVSFVAETLQTQFRDELNLNFENFLKISNKGLPDRIVELLHCFDDEAYKLNGRKYKLPLFQKITPKQLKNHPGRDLSIIQASTSEGMWLLIVNPQSLEEEDIAIFLTEAKKLQQKPQKRVVVSLSSLDANIRLKALEERMWIWSEHELKDLWNLYNKPYIVL